MKRVTMLLLASLLALSLVACSGQSTTTSESKAGNAGGEKNTTVASEKAGEESSEKTSEASSEQTSEGEGGKLRLAFNFEPTGDLNPHMYLPSQFVTQDMVYDGLVYYGENGEIKPALATEWTISEDGKTYTFKLRENVKFSDGSDFNAANVVKNFDTIFSEENKGNHSWFAFTNLLESYKAVDDLTFEFTLTEPYSATLYDLAMIRPIRFLGDAGFPEDGDTAKSIVEPIGTGAWMLKEHVKDDYSVFVPNPNYWGEKPKASEVYIKHVPDSETLALEFEAGNLDFIYGNGLISLDRFNVYKDDPAYVTAVSEAMSTRMVLFNTANEILSDVKVRQALSHAVDKTNVAKNIFGDIEKPADTIFAPNVPHTDVELTPYEFNLEKAGKMLDEAGWVVGSDGIREKDGKKLSLEFTYISAKVTDKSLAEYIQGEWQKLGVEIKLKGMEEKNYWRSAHKGEFDVMFTFSWGAPWDPHAFLTAMTNSSENGSTDFIAQKNLPMKEKIDSTIQQLLIETDTQKLKEEYDYVLSTLHEQAVYIPVTYQAVLSVYRDGELAGLEFMPEENRLPVWKTYKLK